MGKKKDLLDKAKLNSAMVKLLALVVFLSGNSLVYGAGYIAIVVIMIARTLAAGFRKRDKILMCITYVAVMHFQILFVLTVIFGTDHHFAIYWFLRAVGVIFMALPLFIERFVTANKSAQFYLPSVEEIKTISFSYIKDNKDSIKQTFDDIERVTTKLTPQNLAGAFSGSSGHSSVKYVNKGSLTEEFFKKAEESFDDPWMYIVISDTGSAASEIIGSVTRRDYNHASIAFDRELETILSYNGGQNIYPPGMNAELLLHFHQKSDASVLIYRIAATREQKETILNTVKRINEEGSAYNMMGLVTKKSYKPNIMFCSQFVYRMLMVADLAYFEKLPGHVRPTDFIEMDYRRKLEFVEEIQFS